MCMISEVTVGASLESPHKYVEHDFGGQEVYHHNLRAFSHHRAEDECRCGALGFPTRLLRWQALTHSFLSRSECREKLKLSREGPHSRPQAGLEANSPLPPN
ncbi:unnamed protein product, partial [Scytosiphon promiscuus]